MKSQISISLPHTRIQYPVFCMFGEEPTVFEENRANEILFTACVNQLAINNTEPVSLYTCCHIQLSKNVCLF